VAPKKSTFASAAIVSGIVSQEQIDAALAALAAKAGGAQITATDVDDDQLAEQLVEMGVLTGYQATQLKAGKTKLHLGPYIITDFIGQGGMGYVFKAEHELMGRESAVKVLPLHKQTPEAIANFTREIRMQAKLDHPNLVRAYDAGHDGNVHYLVVEYVPGTDLRQLVRRQRRLTMQQAAKIVMQAARGLDYAHKSGLIHRDVKPGNILVTPEGVAKVSDLGLAGFMNESASDPRAGKIVGTADYLSPEQIKTPQDITAASDIYSLGCTLYYAITGKVPYPGGSPSSKARRHCDETPWHPRRFNPEVSEEFVEVIADMMEKDRAARLSSAAEVATRLEPWAIEASPIPSQQMTRSAWLPPPLPTGKEEEVLHETGSATFDISELGWGDFPAPSQYSEGTQSAMQVSQDTRSSQGLGDPAPPPLMSYMPSKRLSGVAYVLLTLAIAVPASLMVGLAVGLVVGALLW